MKPFIVSAAVAISVCHAGGARADDVTLIAPGGIRAAIVQMIPAFEKKTGHKVKATFGSGAGTKQQVARGEAFDVPIVQPPYPEVLGSGHVVASSETPLASVAVGVAVRKGARKPDISTPEAVRRLLLGVKAVAYPDPSAGAAAGVSFDDTLRKLGIADQMKPTIRLAQGGAGAMALLARGEVEIGLTFISEILTEAGVDVVGPLPRAISTPTMLAGFVSAHTRVPEAAKSLLSYLSSAEASAVYKAAGMEPAQTDQQVLIQLEKDWDAAFLRKDVRFIENTLADEFISTYDDGSRGSKALELKLLVEFNQQVQSSAVDDFTVHVYGDTAIVWFTRRLAGPRQGRRVEVTFRMTDTFVRRAGRWQCVASQSTKMTTP
jgi:molybdate transport system substrate-binding protein